MIRIADPHARFVLPDCSFMRIGHGTEHDGVYVEAERGGRWALVTVRGGVKTRIDTGVPFTPGRTFRCRLMWQGQAGDIEGKPEFVACEVAGDAGSQGQCVSTTNIPDVLWFTENGGRRKLWG